MPFSCGVSKNVRRSDPSGVIVSKWKTIIELPALCAVAERCPTRAYVETHGDGRRPCDSMVLWRSHRHSQLPTTLPDPPPLQRPPIKPIEKAAADCSAAAFRLVECWLVNIEAYRLALTHTDVHTMRQYGSVDSGLVRYQYGIARNGVDANLFALGVQ